MRCVVHPGPAARERIHIAPCAGEALELVLDAGQSLEAAVASALGQYDFDAAWLQLEHASVESLRYVIPADAPDAKHVAWYSDVLGFQQACIDKLGMVVGHHNDEIFTHCHGLWTAAGGVQAMGHLLAPQTFLSEPVVASGYGIKGAQFIRQLDDETHFELFHVHASNGKQHRNADFAIVRLMPNIDFPMALKTACEQLGWSQARAYGLGSLNEVRFIDGRALNSLPTEFLVLEAWVSVDAPPPEIVVVGTDGRDIMRGRVSWEENPVLVTAEIFMSRVDTSG